MLHHPPTTQESRQPPPTAPPGAMPLPTPVAPPPRTPTRKRKDQGIREPMLPTQETATSAETALSQGEHQGPYPTMVQRIADLLHKPQELMKRQKEDSHLLGKVQDLNNGGTGGEYSTDEDRLLWYESQGSILCLAIPLSLVPGILAFVYTTYGHLGVARTTDLTQRKYHWTSLKSDVRDYVLSCGCRRPKRSTSQRVAMLPVRFLQPWQVLEMDMHDMEARSEAGSKHLLAIVDRARKSLFAYPLPNKTTAENVAKKLLELLLTFGILLSLRSDPGTEFTAEVVQHLCKWLNVMIDYPRAQGAVERLGGWIHEPLVELCKSWPRRWDEYVQPALWLHRTTPDPRLPGKATPFRLLFVRDCRTQMDATLPSPDDEGMDGLHNLIANKTENASDASDESTTKQGSGAPLPEPE